MSKRQQSKRFRNPIAEGLLRKTGSHSGHHSDDLNHLVEKGIERKPKHKKKLIENWINPDGEFDEEDDDWNDD